ncbi:bifunctional helix-turn-helix transcriptional regulator/GNAT family N-acetyltransferase [Musicola paradisiaca]|nr:bifunctional helix-turn-helix transcriptional regulator/GNAT family N-acetyltransferase [Musicola paradisiaca]
MTDISPDLLITPIREASRRLVRELGFMKPSLADTTMPPSFVHALIEIGASEGLTASVLCERLNLEKSTVSRMVSKLVAAGLVQDSAQEDDGRCKPLSLTDAGEQVLEGINAFAKGQVSSALNRLTPAAQRSIVTGLNHYAGALEACRTGVNAALPAVSIVAGYRPGLIGRVVEMHASYYTRAVGFGAFFESKVAAGLADFMPRLTQGGNAVWLALDGERIIGSVAIDTEDLGEGRAHLRWFIVEDGWRGAGVGRRLLAEAVAHCDHLKLAETHLWTLRGLDAALRLYEQAGFQLAEEYAGQQWGAEMVEQRLVRALPQ